MAGELESVKASVEVLKLAAIALSAKQDLVVAKVQELKDIIAAGGSVDPADVEALLAGVAEAQANLEAASVKADSVLV